MTNIEKAIRNLEHCRQLDFDMAKPTQDTIDYVLKLLKQHNSQKRKMLQRMADVQLSNAPNENHNETQRIYEKGIYDGIQMTFEIITEYE